MQKWLCMECEKFVITESKSEEPKFCTHCGSEDIRLPSAIVETEIHRKKIERFNELSDILNKSYMELKPLVDEYGKLKKYFRELKTKKYIQLQEYQELIKNEVQRIP